MVVRTRHRIDSWLLGPAAGVFPGSRWALGRMLFLALAITLLQVVAVTTLACIAGAAQGGDGYTGLCRWDGVHYLRIAEQGYFAPAAGEPLNNQTSNVAFFPGYPLAGRGVYLLSGGRLSLTASLVLGAQLAAWGFWTYWLLLLRRWDISRQATLAVTLILIAHPAAFFLVVAYAESLFLVGLFGFLYWAGRDGPGAVALAAGHGLLMTATRLGGLPVVYCPLAAQVLIDAAGQTSLAVLRTRLLAETDRLLRLFGIGAVASLAGLAFFAYCQWRFGAWNLYMQTQQAGWNVSADWLWWTRPVNYVCFASTWHPNALWPDDLSRFCMLATLTMFVILLRLEWNAARRGLSQWQTRAVFYLAALAIFWLHAAGVSPILMKSMIRYAFAVHALLLLAAVHLWSVTRPAWQPRGLWRGIATAGLVFLQAALAWRFLCDRWAA